MYKERQEGREEIFIERLRENKWPGHISKLWIDN